ncbi:MAG: thioredoxin family protein [Cyclobacteriaceae bacterium]
MNLRKLTFLFSFFLVLTHFSHGQILEPARWSYDISKSDPKIGEEIGLIFYTTIDQDWYLYSTDFDPELGPMVTEFDFEPNSSYELVGEIKPIGSKKKYDEIWEGEYTYFKEKAEFRQTVKILDGNWGVRGSYLYQVCSDIDGKCIPFDDEFTFGSPDSNTEPTSEDKIIGAFETAPEGNEISAVDLGIEIVEEDGVEAEVTTEQGDRPLLLQRTSNDPYSILAFMLVAFLAGLAALLTPCVFPMIPMTVTFFTGKTGGKGKALFYGFSIILIYTIIGSVIAPFMGPEVANDLATGWLPNIIFFTVFVIFALSFFGLFELTLPHGLVNKMDRQSDKGGLIGVFFMAFTLVLVSFSCTGPIVGSILVESAGGMVLKPILGMLAFSLAFAIPFTLFAIFPNWLNTLPKSGGWLNSVKVVLGFLELAFAFKFLSIADQAYHWGILDREIYLAIWIVIFTLMGFYLLGKIRLPHDSELKVISVPRLILAIATFSFVIYLVPGMFGAPLKALAGYLPPMSTHDFYVQNTAINDPDYEICDEPKYADLLHFPHGIRGYFDFDQAIQCAREQGKPLFIDFTGHGCVNCREMEARVWSHPEVLKRLKEDFVMVALYVDEKTQLPESDWYTSQYDGKIKKSIGKQNADFQITRFNNNAQPYYVILGHDEQPLVPPKAYDLDPQNFIEFLDASLEAHQTSLITLNK